MSCKTRIAREQMSMFSLDCLITKDNPVRLIDLFVEQMDLVVLGFNKTALNKEGCLPYHARDMLKLYCYRYLNRVRSSRKLKAEYSRNIEVWWLLRQLMPGYHTISNFHKDNAAAFKKALKMFVPFLKGEHALSGEMIVIDETKIRAQDNKKNNFHEAGLAKHLAYIENKTQEYISQMDECDAMEDRQAGSLKKQEVAGKVATLNDRKQKYERLIRQVSSAIMYLLSFFVHKRSWGYSYTLLKDIKKVNGEMSIIFTMYNFRCAITIFGITAMVDRFRKWKPVPKTQNIGLLKTL